MSQNGQKIKNDTIIDSMVLSGLFRVNTAGRIETCYQWRACREYIDRPWFVCDRLDGKGYRYVSFRHSRVKAHRLAYALYHRCSLNSLEINHIDGDRLNNSLDNLELVNASRQSKHAYEIGLNKWGVGNHNAKLDDAKVREAREMRACGAQFKEIAAKFGVTPTCARYVCVRHTWKHVV